MENKILKLLLVTSLSYNATFLYSFLMFPNGLQERYAANLDISLHRFLFFFLTSIFSYRQKSSWSHFFPIPKVRNGNDNQASLSVGFNKTSNKGNLANTTLKWNVTKTCYYTMLVLLLKQISLYVVWRPKMIYFCRPIYTCQGKKFD